MLEQMEKNILKILESQEKIEKNQEKLEKNQKEFSEELSVVKENLNHVNKELDNVKEKLDYVDKDLRSFSQHFAVFETEFGLKVDVLFEKYDTDYAEHKKFKKDIESLEDESFKHGVQIEHLSKKIITA